MYRLTVIYGHPTDPVAFDEYYATTHLPLVQRIPGLRRFSVAACESPDGSKPAAHSIAELFFDSADAAAASLGSAEGQAAAGDVPNFATGGATMLFSEA